MTQTPAFYFDILEILAVGRCPACEILRRKSMSYIDHALYALVVDPPTQNRFADSGGYCRRHAEMLFRIPWGSALGVAILYRRLTEDSAAELTKADRRSAGGKSPALRHLQPACPACTVEQEAELGVLEAILSMLKAKDPRMMEAVTGGRGLCLRHTDAALASAPNAETAALVREHGLRTAKLLLDELNEFIRKSDYRNSEEQKGPEGDSWMRAVSWVTGAVPEKEAKAFTPGSLKQQMRNPEEAKE
jgi:hypothetical protein